MKPQHAETYMLLKSGRLVGAVTFTRDMETGRYVMVWLKQSHVSGASIIDKNTSVEDHIATLGIEYDMKVGYKW